MSLYSRRGVSAQKEDVHAATAGLDQGLFPRAFCKIYPDLFGNDADWVNLMHADGAGTKSILAYLYWKQTGDKSVWRGIAQDAIVMNLDDLLCAGVCDNLAFSSTIDRNKMRIPGEVLSEIIEGCREFFSRMEQFGIHIHFMGGETADVGDLVRTIAVNGTMAARWPKSKIISNEKIAAGDVIVGLSGYGKADYEDRYNSGIGSNGLTSARHDLLHPDYATRYPESFEPAVEKEVIYRGTWDLTDEINIGETTVTIGSLLLSPTRTFAPVVRKILDELFNSVHGMVHCTGGGQTKCLRYIPETVRVIKDDLFYPPAVFRLIRESSGATPAEMYQVFNMGTRLEIYTDEDSAPAMIEIAESFGVNAQIIGRVEDSGRKELVIQTPEGSLHF
ncbi:MAG TPA: AIR synthase-related protein [Chitinophagaceae bacterium]|nr:AIR synthase-related protein [Chitinophagaceae bacterium]